MTRPVNTNALLANAAAANGRKGLPLTLDFSNAATIDIVVADEIFATAVLGVVQGVFIDNIDNAHSVTLIFPGVQSRGYRVKCPANAQMWMPVPVATGAFKLEAQGTIGDIAYIELLNVPVAPCVWPSATIGQVTANVAPTQVAFTNRSVVLTGGADNVMNANGARQFLFLKNRSSNAGQITVTFGGGLAVVLAVGESFPTPTFAVNDQAITATGTAGDTLEAAEA